MALHVRITRKRLAARIRASHACAAGSATARRVANAQRRQVSAQFAELHQIPTQRLHHQLALVGLRSTNEKTPRQNSRASRRPRVSAIEAGRCVHGAYAAAASPPSPGRLRGHSKSSTAGPPVGILKFVLRCSRPFGQRMGFQRLAHEFFDTLSQQPPVDPAFRGRRQMFKTEVFRAPRKSTCFSNSRKTTLAREFLEVCVIKHRKQQSSVSAFVGLLPPLRLPSSSRLEIVLRFKPPRGLAKGARKKRT